MWLASAAMLTRVEERKESFAGGASFVVIPSTKAGVGHTNVIFLEYGGLRLV